MFITTTTYPVYPTSGVWEDGAYATLPLPSEDREDVRPSSKVMIRY